MKKSGLLAILAVAILSLTGCGKSEALEKSNVSNMAVYSASFYSVEASPERLLEFYKTYPISVGNAEKQRIEALLERKNFVEYDIHIMAVGDDLMHEGVINSGKQADGSYTYDSLYAGIQPYLDFADIKSINQETIMAGNENGFSGYPTFNSPTEMADSIARVGFNLVCHATNHTCDMGISGLNSCKKYWDDNHPDIKVIGMYGEEGINDDIPIMEVEGVKFAVLNYTYGCNWATVQPNLENHVELLTTYNQSDRYIDFDSLNPDVLDDIARAREMADFVVVFPHWGIEYQTVENAYQDRVAAQMIDAGADIIIGTHPHVCQPVKWITTENGNTGLCYFSLGNFLSSQYDAPTFIEGMAWVTIHVTYDGPQIVTDETGVLPMVLHYESPGNKITQTYAIEDYSEELALRHACVVRSGVTLHQSYLESKSAEIFGDMILSVDTIMSGAGKTFEAVGATQYYNGGGYVHEAGSSSSASPDLVPSQPADTDATAPVTDTQEVAPETNAVSGPQYADDGTEIIYWEDLIR